MPTILEKVICYDYNSPLCKYIDDEVIALIKEEFEQHWPHSQWGSGALAARLLMEKHPEINLKVRTLADKINKIRKVDFSISDKQHLGGKRDIVKRDGLKK